MTVGINDTSVFIHSNKKKISENVWLKVRTYIYNVSRFSFLTLVDYKRSENIGPKHLSTKNLMEYLIKDV